MHMYLHTASMRLMHIPTKHLLDACWYKANIALLVHVSITLFGSPNHDLYAQLSSYEMLAHDEICVCLYIDMSHFLWFSLFSRFFLTLCFDYQEHASTCNVVMFNKLRLKMSASLVHVCCNMRWRGNVWVKLAETQHAWQVRFTAVCTTDQ